MMTARNWFAENGYKDVADLIDEANQRIEAKGKGSRRNWWDTLAGGRGGAPLTREGITFPVLRAAQIRQGKPVTGNAISRSDDEVPPGVVATKRWPRRLLPKKASGSGRAVHRRRTADNAKAS